MAESTVVVPIEGMTCDHCVRAVTSALQGVEGVRDVQVSLEEKKATVVYEDTHCKPADLQAVIETEGYSSRLYGTDSPSYTS